MTDDKFLRVLDGLLTPEECTDFISRYDNQDLVLVRKKVVTYFRTVFVDRELADRLFDRIKYMVDDFQPYGSVVGLNDHFRFAKYEPGWGFGLHQDAQNTGPDGSVSRMTLNIFLNESFEGGETEFFWDRKTSRTIIPGKSGRAALFDSLIYHRGNRVQSGNKYLLRTDLMFASDGPIS